MLIFATGLSGSGKNTILEELVARGDKAYGVDENGYAQWLHQLSEEPIEWSDDLTNEQIHDFYSTHKWKLDVERIHILAEENLNEVAFLVGGDSGDGDVWEYFDTVIVLIIDTNILLT